GHVRGGRGLGEKEPPPVRVMPAGCPDEHGHALVVPADQSVTGACRADARAIRFPGTPARPGASLCIVTTSCLSGRVTAWRRTWATLSARVAQPTDRSC